jgi:mono/diheme cytochrome c family protein
MYHAGGCISCHHRPGDEEVTGLPIGGEAFPVPTPVGFLTLYPPNLTPDKETGLGNWSDLEFVNAVMRGVSPSGHHYIPAFPYHAYARMKITDVLDLKAYLDALPATRANRTEANVPLEPLARRAVGLWKLMAMDARGVPRDEAKGAGWNRGSYLVNGPGHCTVCHTPDLALGIDDESRFLEGGPHPDGKSRKVPSLRRLTGYSGVKALNRAFRSEEDDFVESTMRRGEMDDVQRNLAQLPESDTLAIAEYLMSLQIPEGQ